MECFLSRKFIRTCFALVLELKIEQRMFNGQHCGSSMKVDRLWRDRTRAKLGRRI